MQASNDTLKAAVASLHKETAQVQEELILVQDSFVRDSSAAFEEVQDVLHSVLPSLRGEADVLERLRSRLGPAVAAAQAQWCSRGS
jgi:uncharacterized protein YukE